MTKAKADTVENGDRIADSKAAASAETIVARRTAKICSTDERMVLGLIEGWREGGLFVDPDCDRGRRMTARVREGADVFVASCLVRLIQVGVTEKSLAPLARLCGDIVSSEKLATGDLWLAFASGGLPVTITERSRLIDFIARAKGMALTVLDVGRILQDSRG